MNDQDVLDDIERVNQQDVLNDMRKLDKDVFEGISKYEKGTCPLRTLIDVLEKKPNEILELTIIDAFSNTVLPKDSFSPKFIINYMMEVFANNREKIKKYGYVNGFIYSYKSDDKLKNYIFTDNMTIYYDIITICYLYCITTESEYKESRQIMSLRKVMKEKYTICDDLDISQSLAKHDDLNKITWFKIAHSFPSITFAIFHHDIINVSVSLCTTFSNVNLPKIFNVSTLGLILPRVFQNFYIPLPLFVALAILIDDNKEHKRGEKTPLRRFWQDIYDLYTCSVFPTVLKQYLCYKWDILKLVDNEYIFTSYFEEAADEAISLISCLRPDDPDLHLFSLLYFHI